MKCYLFLTFAIGGSYPHPKGCELATAYLSMGVSKKCVGIMHIR